MSGASRMAGIDLAWLVALVGLMAAPTVLLPGLDPAAPVRPLLEGPPAALVATLAGASAALAARRRLAVGHRSGAVWAMLARGWWIALLGLGLVVIATIFGEFSAAWSLLSAAAPLDTAAAWLWVPRLTSPDAILIPVGVAIAVAAPLLIVPSWALAATWGLLAASGGWIVAAVQSRAQSADAPGGPWSSLLDELLHLAVLGEHPVVTLLGSVVLGMLVGRSLLAAREAGRERRLLAALAAGGAVAAAAGAALRVHGGAGALPPAQVLHSAGIALLVVAAACLLAGLLPSRAWRPLAPLRAAGDAPLTVYVCHLLLWSALTPLSAHAPQLVFGWGAWALQVAAAIAVGWILAATGARGPLDRAVDVVAERFGGVLVSSEPMPHVLPDARSLAYSWRFSAPIHATWRALTDPRLVARWLPDPVLPIVRSTMDVRPGGGYRHVHRAGWTEHVVAGDYLRVEPPALLVQTLQLVGGEWPPVVSITTLSEADGGTVVHIREIFADPALRDAAVAKGMPMAVAIRQRLEALLQHDPGAPDGHDPVTEAHLD